MVENFIEPVKKNKHVHAIYEYIKHYAIFLPHFPITIYTQL